MPGASVTFTDPNGEAADIKGTGERAGLKQEWISLP